MIVSGIFAKVSCRNKWFWGVLAAILGFCLGCSGENGEAEYPKLKITQISSEQFGVFMEGSSDRPILVQHVAENQRPYIHPIVAPDGKGLLTEFQPNRGFVMDAWKKFVSEY
jgi:hypothetical protein